MKLSVIKGILHDSGKRDEHRMRVSINARELFTMTGCKSAKEAKSKGYRAALLGESFGFHHIGMVKSKDHRDGTFCHDIDYVRTRKSRLTQRSWIHKPGCNVFIPVSKLGVAAFSRNPVNRYPEEYKPKKSFRLEIPVEWFKKTTMPPAAAGVFASTAKPTTAKTKFPPPPMSKPSLTPVIQTGANAALAKSVRALNKATAKWAKCNANNPNNLLRLTIHNGQLVVSVTMTTKII